MPFKQQKHNMHWSRETHNCPCSSVLHSEYSTRAASCRAHCSNPYESSLRHKWPWAGLPGLGIGTIGTQHVVDQRLSWPWLHLFFKQELYDQKGVQIVHRFSLGQCTSIQHKRWKVPRTRGLQHPKPFSFAWFEPVVSHPNPHSLKQDLHRIILWPTQGGDVKLGIITILMTEYSQFESVHLMLVILFPSIFHHYRLIKKAVSLHNEFKIC